jgi:hypothetical protein
MEKSDLIHLIPVIGIFSVYMLSKYLAYRATKEPFKRVQCLHQNRYTKIVEVAATCETTVEVCNDCGETLTEPKTEC